MTRVPRRLVVGLVIALALGVLFALSTRAHDLFVGLATSLESRATDAGLLGIALFFLLSVAASLLSPFSSAPLVPSAVLAWGRWWTVVLLVAGWTLGGAIAWVLGRWGGESLLRHSSQLRAFEARVRELPQGASFVTALALRVALPSEVGYAYGILGFDFRRYLAITVLAEIPSALVLVFVSDALLQRRLVALVVAVAVVVALVAVAAIARRWPKGRARTAG